MSNDQGGDKGKLISNFSSKVIRAVGITILMLLLIALFLKGFKVILLLLASIMVAIFFNGVASKIRQILPIKNGFALALSLVLVLGGTGLLIHFLSPSVSRQVKVLEEELPKAFTQISDDFKATDLGGFIDEQILSSSMSFDDYSSGIRMFFNSVFGFLTDIYIIFFLSMFLMFQPKVYKNGLLKLFPKPYRKRGEEVLLTTGYTLKKWLLGTLISMAFIGIFSWVGLTIIGIPMALTLALIAALMTVVPNFGPIVALIPALLLSMVQGFDYALYTFILYTSLQAVESNLITPFIQKKMIYLPLAMILLAQVILGIFTGLLGLILAVPIVAIVMVVVKMLYIEDVLGDKEVEVKGEEKFS